MKIMLCTDMDQFSEAFSKKLNKEGDDVYILSKEKISDNKQKIMKSRYYSLSDNIGMIGKIFESVKPQVVVFAGPHYMDCQPPESGGYLSYLEMTLKKCVQYKVDQFVYLSSVEVYGFTLQRQERDKKEGAKSEACVCSPDSEKGRLYAQGEYLVRLYEDNYKMKTLIMRAGDLYANQCRQKTGDFLARCYERVNSTEGTSKNNSILQDRILWPLHVDDFSEAIKRGIESGRQSIYNIVGRNITTVANISNQLAAMEGKAQVAEEKNIDASAGIDTSAAKKDLEWTDFKDINGLITNREISYIPECKKKELKKSSVSLPAGLRRFIENVFIFIIFVILYYGSSSHKLFSTIDWLLIYVTIISLFFGLRQSALAVMLSSFAYLSMKDLSIFEMTNFYSYAESILKIVQFVFFGLSISYTSDMLRENLRDSKRENELLREDFEELKNINDENIIIKNEYEKRILESKTSLPKLYSIVRRIMVLEPERILMEILHVVSEIVQTNTVAVYSVNGNNPYLRLINALGEESVMDGKTWNISDCPKIQEAIKKGELYTGNVWEHEPAAIVPIVYENRCLAVIVIKRLSFENQTLHHMNLLRTLALLITESIVNAFEYNKETRENRYVADTDILYYDEFKNAVTIAREKQEKGLSEFCILEIMGNEDIVQAYYSVSSYFRTTDYFGTDGNGKLYVLLNNTNTQDAEAVRSRLADHEVSSAFSTDFGI